jgi:vacuolar-type H+-ATPase subunit H
MINNLIEQIKNSEKKSKDIIQEAKKKYSEIIEQAYLESDSIVFKAKSEAVEIVKAAKIKAETDAGTEIKNISTEYHNKNIVILKKAELKENIAIDIIIKKVLD